MKTWVRLTAQVGTVNYDTVVAVEHEDTDKAHSVAEYALELAPAVEDWHTSDRP